MTDAPPSDVRNDIAQSRLVTEQNGLEAFLVYQAEADRLILIHTAGPDELGGRGIGGRLVRAALDHARTEHLTVVPWCPFARRWITDHPGEAAGITIDWDTLPPE